MASSHQAFNQPHSIDLCMTLVVGFNVWSSHIYSTFINPSELYGTKIQIILWLSLNVPTITKKKKKVLGKPEDGGERESNNRKSDTVNYHVKKCIFKWDIREDKQR